MESDSDEWYTPIILRTGKAGLSKVQAVLKQARAVTIDLGGVAVPKAWPRSDYGPSNNAIERTAPRLRLV